MSLLFYVGWTVIFIGILLSHFDAFQDVGVPGEAPRHQIAENSANENNKSVAKMLGAPIHGGMLLAVWATSCMTVGHLLLASAVTAYSVLDSLWSVWLNRARGEGISISVPGQRVSR